MLAHMQAVHRANKRPIYFGGVITSIACAIGLDTGLGTLESLLIRLLDIHACCNIWLIKNMRGGRYSLIIGNIEILSVVLPYLKRTNVRNMANWIYNLNVDTDVGTVPMGILENVNVDGATGDEYDHRV